MVDRDKEKIIAVKMSPDFIARLDRIAKIGKLSRHKIAKNLLELGVEELEKLDCVGVFQLGILIRDLSDKLPLGKPKDPVSGDKPVPFTLDDGFVIKLDRLADKAGLTRHQLMKNLLRVGVDEAEGLARLGMLQFFILVRDLPDAYRGICETGKRALQVTKR